MSWMVILGILIGVLWTPLIIQGQQSCPPNIWCAVYRVSSGELISLGTVIANPLPAGLAVTEIGSGPPNVTQQWDPSTRQFVPRPPPVPGPVDDLRLKSPSTWTTQDIARALKHLLR